MAFDLVYFWKGVRYRPTLGYNLTQEEAAERATEQVTRIQRQAKRGAPRLQPCRFQDILQIYWDSLRAKNRVDEKRPRIVIEKHLLPRFADRSLTALDSEDGLAYIIDRKEEGAADATIRREWNVLIRILNLAVKHRRIERNPFEHVEAPISEMRTRVAEPYELQEIQKVALPEVWRMVVVAILTLLREGRILQIEASWIGRRKDGPWLAIPAAISRNKGNPAHLPLTATVKDALTPPGVVPISGPLFTRWTRSESFQRQWRRTCQRAGVSDLHFHDLRHTGATWLQRCGVGYEVRQALLGHRVSGMTAKYSHGGPEWDAQLREAVMKLETMFVEHGLKNDVASRLQRTNHIS